jgi:hypothetical protein
MAKLDLLEHELLPKALSGGPKGGNSPKRCARIVSADELSGPRARGCDSTPE